MNEQELSDRIVLASDRRYNRLYQENTLFATRLSSFFIAESMLLISYASAINLIGTVKIFGSVICTLGVFVTLGFVPVFFSHISYINKLKAELDKFGEEYPRDYNDFLGKSLPVILTIIWIVLAISYIGQ